MKKIVLFLIVVCASVCANAQFYVGGTASFQTNNHDEKDTEFTIAPEIGYNLNDKWAIGADFHYNDWDSEGFGEFSDFRAGLYARYTCYEKGIVRLFLDGGFGFISSKENYDDERRYKSNGFDIGVRPGVAIKLNDTFSLISKVGFLGIRNNRYEGEDSVTTFNFNLSGANVSFGFLVNF